MTPTNSFNSAFAEMMPRPLALYGAGGEAFPCLDYLRSRNLAECVICVIDNDPAKQGRYLGKLRIQPSVALKEYPNCPVLINTSVHARSMYEQLRTYGLANPVFFWVNRDFLFFISGPVQSYNPTNADRVRSEPGDLDFIASFYDQTDEYTLGLLRLALFCRNHPLAAIQPYDNIDILNRYRLESKFWVGDEEHWLSEEPALTIIDCGAFDGETQTEMFTRYSLEPDPNNFRGLVQKSEQSPFKDRIRCYQVACGGANEDALFFASGDMGALLSAAGETLVRMRRLDDLNLAIKGKLCIKMDVEGVELEALNGAAELIKKHRPHLAISIYHRLEDLYAIPAYLKSLVPEYRCVIRGGVHMVCYASVE